MLSHWTLEEKSYLIGLFQGDGSLYQQTRNRGKLTYCVSIRDKDIIKKIQKLIPCNYSVKTTIKDTNFKKDYKSITLTVCDINFRKEINKYVPYGKKAKIIVPPKKINTIAYIRGLTDADGAVGLTKLKRCFWSLCTSSEKIKDFILEHIKENLNIKKRINKNKRDNVYNICLYDEDAQKYTKLLYENSNLHINRKYKSYLKVKKWKRTTPKHKGIRKWWDKWEDKIVLSNKTIEEKMKALNRTEKSISIRKWRLLKGIIKG